MVKQQDFFEWQDNYVAAEWVESKEESIADPEDLEDAEELDVPPSPHAYLSSYHKDLHQRKSIDSLDKITRIVFIFVGLVMSTFVLGWLSYQSSLRSAIPFGRSATTSVTDQKATIPSESLDPNQPSPQACATAETCDPATVTDLNQMTETINRYREKREEYYDQIEELDQMN